MTKNNFIKVKGNVLMVGEKTINIEGMAPNVIVEIVLAECGLTFEDVANYVMLKNKGKSDESNVEISQELLNLVAAVANQQSLETINSRGMNPYHNSGVKHAHRIHNDGVVDIRSKLHRSK